MNIEPLLPLLVIVLHLGYLRLHYGRINPFSLPVLVDVALYFICVHPQWGDAAWFDSDVEALQFNSLLAAGITVLLAALQWAAGRSQAVARYTLSLPVLESVPPPTRRLFPWILALFSVATVFVVVEMLRQYGSGFWQYFTSERLSVYLEGNTESSLRMSLAYFTMVSMRPLLLVWICLLWSERKWTAGWIVYAIVLMAILSIFRTRLEVLITLALPLVFFHYFRRRLAVWQFAMGFFVFVLLNATLNAWRGLGLASLRQGEVQLATYYSASFGQDLNPSRALARLWTMNSEGLIDHEHGLNYWYTLVSFVPRGVWPSKPITSMEVRWTMLLQEDIRQGVHTYTVFGEGIVQFGLWGALLGAGLYGASLGVLHMQFGTRKLLVLAWFYFAVLAATYIRASAQAMWVLAILYWTPIVLFSFIARMHGGRRPDEQRT